MPLKTSTVPACVLSRFNHVWLFAILWTIAFQVLFMVSSRKEYWSELPCLPPGNLPRLGIEPVSHISCISRRVLYHLVPPPNKTAQMNFFKINVWTFTCQVNDWNMRSTKKPVGIKRARAGIECQFGVDSRYPLVVSIISCWLYHSNVNKISINRQAKKEMEIFICISLRIIT